MARVTGGDRLEKIIRKFAEKAQNAKELRVGFLEDATYPDGKSVAMIAAINEYGAPSRGQPPRPFFRNMIAEKKDSWGPSFRALMKNNEMDAKASLQQLGAGIKGQLQQSITDFKDPPLKPSTIQKKGFAKPLIDTGLMLRSVDYEVN